MIKFYYDNKKKIHPFVLACLIHAQFVEIHPFEDGNGRTGRALMNWSLMKSNYPKIFIPVKVRSKYYEAIDLHNKKDIKGYCTKMFETVIDTIFGALSYFPNKALDLINIPSLRPFVILAICLILGIFSVPKLMRARWARIIFLTIVYYLALSAVGVE